MSSRLSSLLFMGLLVVFTQKAWSQIQVGEVVLEQPEDATQKYKYRRGTHGALLSFSTEQYYPYNYYSRFLDAGVGDITDDARIDLIGGELGYKYNMSLGSFAFLLNYAQGSHNGSVAGNERNLSLIRQGASINYAADVIFDEPYLVPYVQGGVHQFLVTENSVTGEESSNTSMSFNYRFGVLLQLDFLEGLFDKTAKQERISTSSLENVFLDIYMAEYLPSGSAVDPENPNNTDEPNMASNMEMGFGLKLEF